MAGIRLKRFVLMAALPVNKNISIALPLNGDRKTVLFLFYRPAETGCEKSVTYLLLAIAAYCSLSNRSYKGKQPRNL
jgi:hypothetical protein